MNAFDYLHDGSPEIVLRLHAAANDRHFRSLGAFLACAVAVVTFAWAVEAAHLHDAEQSMQRAREQLDRVSVVAARVKAELRALHQAATFERRLYAIRISGTQASNRIVRLALRLPMRSWLTSLQISNIGVTANGRAIGLKSVGEVLAALPGRLMDVHASGPRDDRIVEFQVELPQK